MILSILIPTMPKREQQFDSLLRELEQQIIRFKAQHPSFEDIEIIGKGGASFLDGGMSIGAKRNLLRQLATGRYMCFMDDDDNVAPNYVEQLVRMCMEGADIVTFRCMFKCDTYWSLLNMSLTNTVNEETRPDCIVQRTPWHICPVKTEIAKREPFDEGLNHNEDFTWMQKVLVHVRTEVHTDMVLSQYNHSATGSEADKILQEVKL